LKTSIRVAVTVVLGILIIGADMNAIERQRRYDNTWQSIVRLAYDYLDGKVSAASRDEALALAKSEGVELSRVNALFDEVEEAKADQQSWGLGAKAAATAG
jgi:hypothetical protein